MRYLLLSFGVLVLLSITIIGCDTASSSGLKTLNGTPVQFIVDQEGPIIQPGQYAYFHYAQYVNDSLLQGSHTNNSPSILKLPTPEELAQNPNSSYIMEGLSFMSIGDSLRIAINLDSLSNVPPNIKKHKVLNLDISLLNIRSAEEHNADQEKKRAAAKAKIDAITQRLPEVESLAQQTIKDYNSGKLNSQIKTTDSGLKYLIHEEGTGSMAEKGKAVQVQYYGALTSNGAHFDDSFRRGSPFQLTLGRGEVIQGWDEGLALFKYGTKASLFIPSALGYGSNGSGANIPPNAELYFYIEIQ